MKAARRGLSRPSKSCGAATDSKNVECTTGSTSTKKNMGSPATGRRKSLIGALMNRITRNSPSLGFLTPQTQRKQAPVTATRSQPPSPNENLLSVSAAAEIIRSSSSTQLNITNNASDNRGHRPSSPALLSVDYQPGLLPLTSGQRSTSAFRLEPSPSREELRDLEAGAHRPRSHSQNVTTFDPSAELKRHPKKPKLTDAQKSLLKVSWRHLNKKGTKSIGVMIVRQLYEKQPKIRRLFGFEHVSATKIQYDPVFCKHANGIVELLGETIKSLDRVDDTQFIEYLHAYGKMHGALGERGFRSDYWDVLGEAMSESAMEWEGPGKHRETIRCWTCVIAYVINEIRFAFDVEVKRRRRVFGTPDSGSPSPQTPSPRSEKRRPSYSAFSYIQVTPHDDR